MHFPTALTKSLERQDGVRERRAARPGRIPRVLEFGLKRLPCLRYRPPSLPRGYGSALFTVMQHPCQISSALRQCQNAKLPRRCRDNNGLRSMDRVQQLSPKRKSFQEAGLRQVEQLSLGEVTLFPRPVVGPLLRKPRKPASLLKQTTYNR